ncbi:hypothetical protein F4561_006200 [Lipingzhangella halophila]|uniref:Uncharacterized protein n=1 Tax=Lipingzhangella halophila TaxID=1783352 RepID=A0A7W7RPP7_9ACTN|nr:hypothetical protein [Lipingzhangella halophila]MBB4935306.1 hypothetical protein [Lipingzhangella halophila]
MSSGSSSITQHYVFTHILLRNAVLSKGSDFPHLVENQTLHRLLATEWQNAAEEVPVEARCVDDPPTATGHQIPGHDVVLITMPPPKAPTEAYFAAVTVRRTDLQVRYLLLEHSLDVSALLGLPSDDGPRSVMAEWRLDSTSQEPSHVNFGDRPVLPADTFLAEVERLLG